MPILDNEGRRLLNLLVFHLNDVTVGNMQTYITYREVHNILNLDLVGNTYGISLQHQGLASLADWTFNNQLPAITGLIISNDTQMPGNGYFTLFGRNEYDFEWWNDEIRRSIVFDWNHFLVV